MSSYFDNAQRMARKSYADLVAAEEQVFRDVTAITGDREFPADLREAMLGVMAAGFVWQPGCLPPPVKAKQTAEVMGYSSGIEHVHELFHDLARRRVVTRFGMLSDSPTQMAKLRYEHDET